MEHPNTVDVLWASKLKNIAVENGSNIETEAFERSHVNLSAQRHKQIAKNERRTL